MENCTFFQILKLSVEKWDIFQQLFCNFSSTKYLLFISYANIFETDNKNKVILFLQRMYLFLLESSNRLGLFHVWKINTFNSVVTFCKKYVCELYPSKTIFFRRLKWRRKKCHEIELFEIIILVHGYLWKYFWFLAHYCWVLM